MVIHQYDHIKRIIFETSFFCNSFLSRQEITKGPCSAFHKKKQFRLVLSKVNLFSVLKNCLAIQKMNSITCIFYFSYYLSLLTIIGPIIIPKCVFFIKSVFKILQNLMILWATKKSFEKFNFNFLWTLRSIAYMATKILRYSPINWGN